MTYEEAANILDPVKRESALLKYDSFERFGKFKEACLVAAELLRNATEIKPDCNQPLTLDKVWKMNGRPVVVKYIYGGPDTIGIVDVRFVPYLGTDKIRVVFANGYITVNEKDYGHYYNLYDYNPAYIDREAWDDCPVCGKYKEISFRGFRTKEEAMNLSGKVYPHITGGAMFCPKCGKPRNERAWADLEQRLRG